MGTIEPAEPGDLDAVRVFGAVAHAGSFTAAARALGIPKSSVSRRVSALEARLGTRLLQRTTRRVTLTEAGEVYYERVARALGELREAEAALAVSTQAPSGVLRLTAPVDLGHDVLPQVIAGYQRAYPDVAVVAEVDNRRVDLVAEGFDLAIRATGTLEDSSLVARKLMTAPLRLFASTAYLRAHGTPQTPAELAAHALILFRAPKLRASLSLRGAEGRVTVEVQGKVSSGDFGFLRRAMREGLGIALLPTSACAADLEAGRVQLVLPDYDAGHSAVYAVYPSGRHVPPKVRAFVELLATELERALSVCPSRVAPG